MESVALHVYLYVIYRHYQIIYSQYGQYGIFSLLVVFTKFIITDHLSPNL